MKIAVLSAFYPYRGGIAHFSTRLAENLISQGHEVACFTFTRQYPDFLFPGKTQLEVDEAKPDAMAAKRLLDSINPFSYRKTARAVKAEVPELYISNYWMTFFGPAFGFVASRLRKKCKRIAILHNVQPHERRFFDAAFNKYFLKKHDGFVVLSDHVLKDLLDLNPTAKYVRIDHPLYEQFGTKMIREEAAKKIKVDSNLKTILFFGLIRQYKGLDILLEAVNGLGPDYQLIIAGESYEDFEIYEALIREVSDVKIIVHERYIPDEDVKYYFSVADVCVLPYRSATQSGIVAIAHQFAVPVITTDVGGLKESVHNGINGIVLSENTAGELRKQIENYFMADLGNKFAVQLEKEQAEKGWGEFCDKLVNFSKEL